MVLGLATTNRCRAEVVNCRTAGIHTTQVTGIYTRTVTVVQRFYKMMLTEQVLPFTCDTDSLSGEG